MTSCVKDIHHNPAFKLLSVEELAFLNKGSAEVSYKKHEIILKQGAVANTILFAKTGIFKLHMEGAKHDIIMTLKREESFLGLSSLFSENNSYQYSVTALEDCIVKYYDKKVFETILSRNVKFSNEILMYINHNFSRIIRRFLCVAQKNARGKVAEMLLCLSSSLYEDTKFTLNLSRSELADFAGLSMENTIRILKEFNEDEIISLEGKKIAIINQPVLEKISDFG
ncbi:MAG TPA: Crp/Fnr family transcriptional regulator [Lutibacter sp.]|nr:Crp/Fnr family transcriptional regulator [Lutibacter sp.]